MTILYDKKAPNWDEYLPAILFSYRVSVNDATGQSPYFLQHGRESTLPSDLIFSIDDDVEKGENDFVSNMASKLKEAFTLARNKQYAQARENKDRSNAQTNPDFKPGDWLYVYMKNASESRLDKVGGASLPTKWTYPWQGPFKMIRQLTNNKCMISMRGRNVEMNVNRLCKHKQWDDLHITSDIQKDSVVIEQAPPFYLTDLMNEDIIVLHNTMTDEGKLPFVVAKILDQSNQQDIKVQWLGNVEQSHTGKFLPGWRQKGARILQKQIRTPFSQTL